MRNKENNSGRGGFLPESNDLSIGLIPLRKNRWLEMRVRLLNPLILIDLEKK